MITVGVGPQNKVLIKLASETYHVVKMLKLDVTGKMQKDSRAQNNNTDSILTTTTLLKRTKKISSVFSLFICEYFVSRRYQYCCGKTRIAKMHAKETLTCSVASRLFYYLCSCTRYLELIVQIKSSSDKMCVVEDILVSSDFLGARDAVS